MYKNLSPSAIGIFARQSELLEIALTHRFKGLEIDIVELLRRATASSPAQACRYLCSAQVKIGGFELPVRWAGDEKDFQADLSQLGLLLELCAALDKLRTLRSEQILSVRLAEIPAATDLATIAEEQRLMPGDGGMIDSPAILAVLEDLGYDGPVALAPNPGLFKGQKREAIVRL